MRVRPAREEDAAAIADIYAFYVGNSIVTFDTEAPDGDEFRARMDLNRFPWLVAEDEGAVAGYAYASGFRARAAYRFAVETTVYVRPGHERRGLGRRLYAPLLATLEAQGFTQAIAALTLPNAPSVGLHERLGFRHVGTYAHVGWKLGAWLDVGLWQRELAPAETPPREPRSISETGFVGL